MVSLQYLDISLLWFPTLSHSFPSISFCPLPFSFHLSLSSSLLFLCFHSHIEILSLSFSPIVFFQSTYSIWLRSRENRKFLVPCQIFNFALGCAPSFWLASSISNLTLTMKTLWRWGSFSFYIKLFIDLSCIFKVTLPHIEEYPGSYLGGGDVSFFGVQLTVKEQNKGLRGGPRFGPDMDDTY